MSLFNRNKQDINPEDEENLDIVEDIVEENSDNDINENSDTFDDDDDDTDYYYSEKSKKPYIIIAGVFIVIILIFSIFNNFNSNNTEDTEIPDEEYYIDVNMENIMKDTATKSINNMLGESTESTESTEVSESSTENLSPSESTEK